MVGVKMKGDGVSDDHVEMVTAQNLVLAGLIDAVKYMLRGDNTTAEQKLASATNMFHRKILKNESEKG
jgi:hypothetical protein